jgi:hypothetical protein
MTLQAHALVHPAAARLPDPTDYPHSKMSLKNHPFIMKAVLCIHLPHRFLGKRCIWDAHILRQVNLAALQVNR